VASQKLQTELNGNVLEAGKSTENATSSNINSPKVDERGITLTMFNKTAQNYIDMKSPDFKRDSQLNS
tara:strand:+ start:1127 stop:1330 length:204 start_codon:yes stop_codon:yes gene_type:complete